MLILIFKSAAIIVFIGNILVLSAHGRTASEISIDLYHDHFQNTIKILFAALCNHIFRGNCLFV